MPFSHIRALLCIHILSNCILQFSEVQFSSECLHIFQYVKDGVKLDSDVLKSEPDDQYLFTNLNYTRIFYSYTPYQLSCYSSCPALFRLWHLKTTEIKIKSNLHPARIFWDFYLGKLGFINQANATQLLVEILLQPHGALVFICVLLVVLKGKI